MEGDMDMDVFNTAQDNEGFEGDEETSFIDVDEDFYDNFSRAVASDTLENYDWGSQEQYEAARSKYMKEHGASNVPSWIDLSDQVLSPLYYEDPLTTIKGAQEKLIELYPNTNLNEIQLSKKDGKIYIRSIYKQRGKLGALKPLFTKDGEISADLLRYNWFKEATRNRLQELEELNRRLAAQRELEDLTEKLSNASEKILQLEDEKQKAVEAQREERNLLNSKIIEREVELHNRNQELQNLQKEFMKTKTEMRLLKRNKKASSVEGQDKYQMLEEKAAKLSKKLEDAEKEATVYKKEKMEALKKEAQTSEKVDSIEKEKASLLNERNTLSEEFNIIIKAYKEEESTSNRLRDEVKREREQYNKLSLRVKDLEDELQNKEVMLKRMQKMKENAEKTIAQQEHPTKEQLEELREYREKEHIIKEESERVTKELIETRERYDQLIEEIKKVKGESLKEHEAQIESLKKELKEKEEQLRRTEEALEVEYKKREQQVEIVDKNSEREEEIKEAKYQLSETASQLYEIKEVIKKREEEYAKQNKLLLDTHSREKSALEMQQRKTLDELKTQRMAKQRLTEKSKQQTKRVTTLLTERDQLLEENAATKEELEQLRQKVKELEEFAEKQREFLRDNSKTEEEIEAEKEKLEGIQERIAELESRKENLERVLGLTRREKILRYLKRAGLGLAAAGAIASIVSLIMNALDATGSIVKKLGTQVANLGKKMAAAIPGLLGSVLSLIFRTGGELLKFLGNNIWILVVAVGAVILKSLTEKSSRR